ncbi:MAG: hypothetical protein QM760_00315 [Nibricoccus sp.]
MTPSLTSFNRDQVHVSHAFPERPSDLNLTQAVGVVLCGLLLSAIAAALIISLG